MNELISRQALIEALSAGSIGDWDQNCYPCKKVLETIDSVPVVEDLDSLRKMCEELKAHVDYLSRQKERLQGEVKALSFAVRCGGVSGNEVRYE